MSTGVFAKAVLVVASVVLGVCNNEMMTLAEDMMTATCTIKAMSGIEKISGTVSFSQKASGGKTTLVVQLTGFPKSNNATNHGFHVHESGNLSDSCNGAGPHYNPHDKDHGAPNVTNRHVGDLGNVAANSKGDVDVTIEDSIVSLVGEYSILNRAIVVHETFDDLGLGGFNDSKTTGHAGKRFGCCVIIKDQSSSAKRKWDTSILTTVSMAILASCYA